MKTVKVKLAEIVELSTGRNEHTHSHRQIVIGLLGESKISIDGEIGLIKVGQGCIVSSNTFHSFQAVGISEVLLINAPIDNMQYSHSCEIVNELLDQNCYFQLDRSFFSLITLLLVELKKEPHNLLLRESCHHLILSSLKKYIYIGRANRHRLNISNIDQYIAKNIANKISISQLATCVFLGGSQFHVLFKEVTGITPHQYLLNKRFMYARELLDSSALSISDIANRSGFSSQSAFTNLFTKKQGISPAKYRS